MGKTERFSQMDGYTFDEGVAFLVLVKAPLGVINHLKATHNRRHLHSEIHKQLRQPRVREILRRNGYGTVEDEASRPEVPRPASEDNASRPEVPHPASEDTEIVLTLDDVRRHKRTRLEDMPNELTRTLWLKRQDVYREMKEAHLRMRLVPEGEEHNGERAKWRAEVLRLDEENDAYWKQIDEEAGRFEAEQSRVSRPEAPRPGFDLSTCRSYVSKALRKRQLTPAQLAELQRRVEAMLAAKVEMKPETLGKLKALGIAVG